jgi:hypothetical protein
MTEKEKLIAICERTKTKYRILPDGSICIYGGYQRDLFVEFTKQGEIKGFV